MKDLFLILSAIGCMTYAAYIKYIEFPNQEKRIEEFSFKNERLLSENKSLKKRAADLEKINDQTKRYLEKELNREVVKKEDYVLPSQDSEQKQKETVKPEQVVDHDYEAKLKIYNEKKSKILSELKRGELARQKVEQDQPDFQEHRIVGGKKYGIRTSDSDRQKWYDDRADRLRAIDEKIANLRG